MEKLDDMLRVLTLEEHTIKHNLIAARQRLEFALKDIMRCEAIPYQSKLELMYNGAKADWRLDSLIHEFNYPIKDMPNDEASNKQV